jgi:hypothetical protein
MRKFECIGLGHIYPKNRRGVSEKLEIWETPKYLFIDCVIKIVDETEKHMTLIECVNFRAYCVKEPV